MPVRRGGGGVGGKGRCATCDSPHRELIDAALVDKRVSLGLLASRYAITKSSLVRHRTNHLSASITTIHQEQVSDGSARTVLAELADGLVQLRGIYEAARRTGNGHMAILALREMRGHLELTAKITGELKLAPLIAINLVSNPEWVALRSVVLAFVQERLSVDEREELAQRLRLVEHSQNGHAH